MLKVFIPKERREDETRVAATPETVKKMVKDGFAVTLEEGAGVRAHFSDEAFAEVGAMIVKGDSEAWNQADVVLKVNPPIENDLLGGHEADALKAGSLFIGFVAPFQSPESLKRLRDRKISTVSMELIPRITRAQNMDALSSQASIAGYKSVLIVAERLDKYFPMLMTAAGTIQATKLVIMGAGVAGLQAVATARRLGAIVEVSDIRPAVKEEVESLGGRFIDLPELESGEGEGGYARQVTPEFLRKQQAIVREHVIHADAVITTALVPGKRAPRLVTAEMVQAMRPGAVILDMAVAQGGNCELSREGKDIVAHGVTIVGNPNIPATMPRDASLVYSRNLYNFMKQFVSPEALSLDLEDDIVSGALLIHQGQVRNERVAAFLDSSPEEVKS